MKALSSTESPGHRSRRKVSKPLMEKRRRERINGSLETLRLLMLENTQNEKLKNPKVEKAEILESVVEFLKREKELEKDRQTPRRMFPEDLRPTSTPHHSYHDGMKSCLLRVSQFIASKSRELEANSGLQASLKLSESQELVSSLAPTHGSPVVAPADVPVLSPHLLLQQESRQTLTFSSSMTAPVHVSDPVWRPWPK
ncbi:PREDICTED: transcription factor HES-7.1-A-like [Cyprinodon variegatus]|uniref:Hairy-related 5 n=1 Tax=Cyprinodon variegatus TaxID=28743 RepID=A0A3Q2DBW1_CYPVA|nr:PREDICTED: transcription factor HES-7.1-A-like [Cyprinodon variegatus]